MPMLTSQVADMDKARMDFIDKLNRHTVALREELRISELLLHSVIKSLSGKTPMTEKLDMELTALRRINAEHQPHVSLPEGAAAIQQIEEALRGATKRINRQSQLEDLSNEAAKQKTEQ